ncbi:MAG: enoyl-CoA hydratase/isomerase family protein [Planctomycetota bacterium]|jgi:enoyl-CoA hydratase
MLTVTPPNAHGVAVVTLAHGKVNAIRREMVEALDAALDELEADDATGAVVLAGEGPFFSFGFDVPHFLDHDRAAFEAFLRAFTSLYTRLFTFPKPIVAAVNGHAVAGGWMLAQACDARVIARGNVKLGLNEVRFGAALFAGSVEILRHLAGGRGADLIAAGGQFLGPDEALALGLADALCDADALPARAVDFARHYAGVRQPSFAQIRRLVRGPVVDGYRDREDDSIERFLDIWYRPEMREALAAITIR